MRLRIVVRGRSGGSLFWDEEHDESIVMKQKTTCNLMSISTGIVVGDEHFLMIFRHLRWYGNCPEIGISTV